MKHPTHPHSLITLDLKTFFQGKVHGHGAIFHRYGGIITHFHIRIEGAWSERTGTMQEWFTFEDGSVLERQWHVTYEDDGKTFYAQAPDVKGKAYGRQEGSTAYARYVLNVPYKGWNFGLSMDDRMYLLDDRHLLNRTRMKKFGITLGDLVIYLEQDD